ncbi:MAG: hypothetical protein AAF690_09405 [Acidobacteriota bacterium]
MNPRWIGWLRRCKTSEIAVRSVACRVLSLCLGLALLGPPHALIHDHAHPRGLSDEFGLVHGHGAVEGHDCKTGEGSGSGDESKDESEHCPACLQGASATLRCDPVQLVGRLAQVGRLCSYGRQGKVQQNRSAFELIRGPPIVL